MEIQGIGALVTGGGSGLGEATAHELAARGAKVAVIDMNAEKGEAVAKAIGRGAIFIEANVTSEEGISAAVDKTVDAFGSFNAVVNCAGIGAAARIIRKDGTPFDLATFKFVIDVNLVGTFNVARFAASRMLTNTPNDQGECGVIVNTASIAAFEGQIGQIAYSASKGGIVGMTLPIARDLARHGIRCCTIAPGLFDTPLLGLLPEDKRQALGESIPFPSRLGHPQEFAGLACHIVENPMLNGETLRLDGALRMPPR